MKEIRLDYNSEEIQYLSKCDKRLGKVISMIGPISYKLYDDPFAFLVHEIVEQMLSKAAAEKIYTRLFDLCDGKLNPENILNLEEDKIRKAGVSSAKVKYIKALSYEVATGSLNFTILNDMPDKEVVKALTRVQGIGNWTAKMYLIFVLNRLDVLPFEDGAFLQSFSWLYKIEQPTREDIIKKCKKWSPYSSIAARYLYKTLDMGYTKEAFHLFR